MSSELAALLANVRWMTAIERSDLANRWSNERTNGTLLLTTCHRAELYGSSDALADLRRKLPAAAHSLKGREVVEHLVRVAVGRDSSVVAEDQILHQLRSATGEARRGSQLPRELDRLLDTALHAGRVARSWLPARRPNLVDIAIDGATAGSDIAGRTVLVVGTGEMGRSAVTHLLSRKARVVVTSRSVDAALVTAERFGIRAVGFDPGAELIEQLAGIVVALGGQWLIGPPTRAALLPNPAWIVDMSAPPALDPELVDAVRGRLVTIDDLGTGTSSQGDAQSARLVHRLDQLIDQTVGEFEQWSAADKRRETAQALAIRARDVRSAELERLWQRVPSLNDDQRAEVERAFDHATQTLLREPFEQLGRDNDGRQAEAVKELFRL